MSGSAESAAPKSTVGAATVRCQACGARYDVAISVRPPRTTDDGDVICRLHIDDVDEVALQLFAVAHRGPLSVGR